MVIHDNLLRHQLLTMDATNHGDIILWMYVGTYVGKPLRWPFGRPQN